MSVKLISTIALAALAMATVAMSTPASAGPVCLPGFKTIYQKTWILKCRRVVDPGAVRAVIAQAQNANCKTDSYWNYGPKVRVLVGPARLHAFVTYTCGHVEG